MQKTIAVIVCLMLLCGLASAGGMSTKKPINPVTEWSDPWEVSDAQPIKVQTIEKIITKEIVREKPDPSQGFATALHGSYPGLIFKTGILEGGVYYTKVRGDQSGIINGAVVLHRSDDRYTELKLGASFYSGLANLNYGIYGELEQYLTDYASAVGIIYILRDNDSLSEAMVGGRWYL